MAEIRINSKPCPNCGYRNVTGEARVCERCGTSIIKGKLLIYGGIGVLALVLLLAAGIWISQKPTQNNPDSFFTTKKEFKDNKTEFKELEPTKITKEDLKDPVPVEKKPEVIERDETPVTYAEPLVNKVNMPAKYLQEIEGASLLAPDLPVRVQSGPVANFRSKAFEKIATDLKSPEFAGKKVYVIAFSEAVGSAFVAENRAKYVRKVLRENYRISNPVQVYGFGPVRGSRDADTRRIEVWVK